VCYVRLLRLTCQLTGTRSFGIYNLDVRRVVPLGNLLVEQLRTLTVAAKKEGDSLRDAKLLQFVQPFLAEATVRRSPCISFFSFFSFLLCCDNFHSPRRMLQWRAADYNLQVLELLAARISSPFKQVREELSHVLVTVLRNLWRNPAVEFTAPDACNRFFASVLSRVYTMKKHADHAEPMEELAGEVGDAMDEGQLPSTSPAEDTSHAREALLLALSYAVRKASSPAIAPYIHYFLRILFASLADEDRVHYSQHWGGRTAVLG
jgi:hypothetical protein